MEYFRILNLNKEPFSNSPEPDFFYQSVQHRSCLQQLELAVRLKRGLNVVIGDVGTGKTTLCRQLILKFSERDEAGKTIQPHLLMDPSFSNAMEFLSFVAESFGLDLPGPEQSEWRLKEAIKAFLFEKCVEGGETVVLIIDEGQKMPDFCLELLREFLNYETNEYKLLQIVVFAQRELLDIISRYPNFRDRINQYFHLSPLDFKETRRLIGYRIARAADYERAPRLFTLPGLWAVYRCSGGYPRRIISLCHQVMLALIIQNKSKAGFFLVRSCAERVSAEKAPAFRWSYAFAILVVLFAAGFWLYGGDKTGIDAKSIQGQAKAPGSESLEAAAPEPEVAILKQKADEPAGMKKEKPEILGVLKIERGQGVFRILQEVYGKYDPELLDAFRRMNPHIQNIHRVYRGDAVRMPAVAVADNPLRETGCRVRVAAKSTLDDALSLLRQYPQDQAPVRLFPYWNDREGLVFSVLTRDAYPDEASAYTLMKSAGSDLVREGRVVCRWEPGTVFYGR